MKPTSKIQVSCDTYESQLEATVHKVNSKYKLHLKAFNGNNDVELSLNKEDVKILIAGLKAFTEVID